MRVSMNDNTSFHELLLFLLVPDSQRMADVFYPRQAAC
jgi:hypothetical protein